MWSTEYSLSSSQNTACVPLSAAGLMYMFVFKLSSQLVNVPVFAPVSVNVTAWSAVAISDVAQIPELQDTL
jgi:hypothetical protein